MTIKKEVVVRKAMLITLYVDARLSLPLVSFDPLDCDLLYSISYIMLNHKAMLAFCWFAMSVLEWEKSETEKEISETTKALDWEIDISRLYEEGLETNTNYRLVSMVKHLKHGHICLCYSSSVFLSYSVRISGM